MKSLFVTGASGLIGNRLLQQLDASRYDHIFCLTRNPFPVSLAERIPKNVVQIHGDLFDHAAYESCLRECESVVHLAGVTGKAAPTTYFEVNVRGTEHLLSRCEQAGVTHFVHMSTIAVKYPPIRRYHYAYSKRLAEDLVTGSKMPFTIVRPTIVLAEESRIWRAFLSLARLPRPIVFGSGATMIQPIYIDDFITCLQDIVNERLCIGETIEIGGPQPVAYRELLANLHFRLTGAHHAVVPIPIGPLMAVTSLLEASMYQLLPINSGQLAAFIHDGTIKQNELVRKQAPSMLSNDAMLKVLIANGDEASDK
ncbi:MAG: NAD-dependent epimerase/dehydratase family protein [Chloroflexota bacterium]